MPVDRAKEFGKTAVSLAKNPLGIIALFIVLVYGLACLVIITGSYMSAAERLPIIYFLITFPFIVLGVFTYLVAFRAGQLFAPGDFKKAENYLELQKMRIAAVASLTIAKQTKNSNRVNIRDIEIDDVAKSVEAAVNLAKEGSVNPSVLWVDDNPRNNTFEVKALSAVGIHVMTVESTIEALQVLSNQSVGAIISDMGRREGPREGYTLLDTLRDRGDETPLFFYAGSNAAEHRQETKEHGGQGCTNDGQDLFDMVTKVIFGPQPVTRHFLASRKTSRGSRTLE